MHWSALIPDHDTMPTHLGRGAIGRNHEFDTILGQDPLQELEEGLRGWGSWVLLWVSGCWDAWSSPVDGGERGTVKRRIVRYHTSTAEGVDNLVGLLLVIKIPGLFERPRRCGLGALFLLAEIKAIEHKDAGDAEAVESLYFLLDVGSQGEREAAECAQEGFAG